MITNEGEICTNCASYVLCIPQCEDASGEWGACGKFKQIVNWDETCDGWWEANKGNRPWPYVKGGGRKR